MAKIEIILVDDHTLFIDGLSSALSKENDLNVMNSFTSGKDLLDYLKLGDMPDLVIVDISMPEMNGIELVQRIRQEYQSLKILVASMFEPMITTENINGYVSKNSDISEFLKAIRTIVLEDRTYFQPIVQQESIEEFNKNILTRREKEIISLIAQELTVDQIAEKLFISRLTVETHKKNIFFKLKVRTNAGLVKKAIKLGYIV